MRSSPFSSVSVQLSSSVPAGSVTGTAKLGWSMRSTATGGRVRASSVRSISARRVRAAASSGASTPIAASRARTVSGEAATVSPAALV